MTALSSLELLKVAEAAADAGAAVLKEATHVCARAPWKACGYRNKGSVMDPAAQDWHARPGRRRPFQADPPAPAGRFAAATPAGS
jgi:hypothetical protein